MRNVALLSAGAVAAVTASTLIAPAAVAAVDPPAIPIVRQSPSIAMPTQYPSQPELPVPEDFPTDASIARGVIPYDEIAPFINDLMDRSDRVSAQIVGQSSLGRDIYMVTLTSPETPAETAQQAQWRYEVKHDTAAAEDGALAEGYKVPLWYNANIHGNEWEGTDATLNYIEELATSEDPATQELLDEHRIYFTVTNNPDGRALGQRATATGYDPNRDFITNATVESTIVRDLASIIQPTYFIDLHGYTGVLQVEPCGPPHGENYEYDLFVPHAYATALDIEQRVVEAGIEGNPLTDDGGILIPYRDIRSGWDDWPPIFAPQYVAFQGAVTNTVELPLGRGAQPANLTMPQRSAINIEVAEIVIDTVADYVQENSASLLSNQIEIFSRGAAGTPSVEIPADVAPEDLPEGVPTEWTDIWDETDIYTTDFPRAYVIPQGEGQRSDSDAQTLVQQLLVNGIEVSRTTEPLTVDGTTYPSGSYYVDMHQPLRGLANALLDEGSDITERVPDMYDISAWSLALLWGADVAPIGDTTDPAPTEALEPIEGATLSGSVAAGGDYLAFEPRGVADYQAISELLDDGVALSQLPDGTVVLRRSPAADAAAQAAADLYGVDFAVTDGLELRGGDAVGLERPRIAYVANSDDRDALAKLGFADAVPVTAATLTDGTTSLEDIDLLWVGGSLNFNAETQAAGRAAVQAYLDAGKPVVGRGAAAASFVRSFGLAELAAVSGTRGSNGIVSVDTAEDGVLADYPQDTAFVYPAVWFTGLGDGVTVERSYAADPLVSGHWAASAGASRQDAAGQASEVSAVGPAGGKVFLFGTSPTFRNHPVGAFSDIARALYWASAGEDQLVAPISAEDLTDETRGAVDAPESATVGTDVPVAVGGDREGQTVTGYLFDGPVRLGQAVVTDGVAVFRIPADVEPGEYRLALTDAEGGLIGWDDISLVAAAVDPEPTPEPTTPVATPLPTTTTGPVPAGSSGDLASTGGGDTGSLWAGALALMTFGAGLFVLARTRRQQAQQQR